MSGHQKQAPAPDETEEEVRVPDEIVMLIDGEEIRLDRAETEALAAEIAASPDGDGAGALFTFLATMPGAEMAAEQEISPAGPGPREEEIQDEP